MQPHPVRPDGGLGGETVEGEATRHRRHGAHPPVVGVEHRQSAGGQPFHQLALGCRDRLDRAEEANVRQAYVEHDADGGRGRVCQLTNFPGPRHGVFHHQHPVTRIHLKDRHRDAGIGVEVPFALVHPLTASQ